MGYSSETGTSDGESRSESVVRDDSGDLASLFDLLRDRRRAGGRAKLIDTGKLAIPDLERLAEAGMEITSSDAVRTEAHGLVLIAIAARKGGSSLSYFVHGPLDDAAREAGIALDDVLELGRTGARLAVSSGRVARAAATLGRLADACRKGGTRLIQYHAGPAEASLVETCRAGAWLHLDAAAQDPADAPLVRDCARAARSAGAGLVLHVSGTIDPGAFADLYESGAFILFHTPPADYRDPRRALEARAKARPLPASASHLFPGFML